MSEAQTQKTELQLLMEQAGLKPPYISVIVPIYNVEPYLRRALDSLVYQKLQEIEIICVNDASPDRSQAIVDEYVSRYPGMVVSLRHEENRGLSMARLTGYKHARAPYIMFLDSDDYLETSACMLALERALKGNHDLVVLNCVRFNEKTGEMTQFSAIENTNKSKLIRQGLAAFWGMMYHRDLLRDESLFVPQYFEDAAATPRIMAAARSIGSVMHSWQYCWLIRDNSITTSFFTGNKAKDWFKADEILWSHAQEPYKADFAYRICMRMESCYRQYPSMRVGCIQHIHRMYPQLKPFLPGDFPWPVKDFLEKTMTLKEEQPMPGRIYLNGFDPQKQDLAAYQASVLPEGFDAETVVLDESNCDVKAAPESIRTAWKEKRYEDVAAYFAMVRIAKDGGIYAAPGSHVTPNVESLRYDKAFFCAGMEQTVLLHFFGGAAGNQWMKKIIALLETRALPLQDAVCEVLLAEGAVHLMGGEEQSLDGLHILSALQGTSQLASSCCYVNYAPAGEDLVTMPRSTYLAEMKAIQSYQRQAPQQEPKPRFMLLRRLVLKLPAPVVNLLRRIKYKLFG